MTRFFFFFFLFISFNAFCQKTFVNGYVVDIKGDTVHGLINDKDWDQNPDQIEFKTGEKISFLKPHEILWFRTESGSFYRGAITTVDKSPFKADRIKRSNANVIVTDSVFLEVLLLNQNVSLYRLKDEIDKTHFYIDKNKNISELLLKFIRIGNSIGTQNIFREQLKSINPDNCSIDFSGVRFEAKSLLKTVEMINACTKSVTDFKKTTERVATEITAVGGVSHTIMKISGGGFGNLELPPSITPTVGIGFNFIFPKNKKRTSLYPELIYKSYKSTLGVYDYELKYLRFNFFYRRTFTQTFWKPYLQLGMSNSTAFKSKADGFNRFRKYEQGLLLCAGVKPISKVSTELRYERSNGISNLLEVKSAVATFYFLLSYHF